MHFTAELGDIIHQVGQTDLELEERRVLENREKRKALRTQAEAPGSMNISELVKKISGTDDEQPQDEQALELPKTGVQHDQKRPAAFPAPPVGPGSTGS